MSVRRLRPIVTSILIALAACGRSGSHQPPPPKVTVARPVEHTLFEWDEYTARLEAVESVEVRPRVSGYLQSVLFAEGGIVQKGDCLFQIDPRPYEAALRRAQGELELAQARLELARKNLARADPSAPHAGDLAGGGRHAGGGGPPGRGRGPGGAGGGRQREARRRVHARDGADRRARRPPAGDRGQPRQRRPRDAGDAAHDDRVARPDLRLLRRRRAVVSQVRAPRAERASGRARASTRIPC